MEKTELRVYAKTGVSCDYWNEILPVYFAWERDGGVKSARKFILDNPLRKYRERYEGTNYIAIVNKENIETIEKIDKLVEEMNAWARGDSEDISYIATRFEKISVLLYGSTDYNNWVVEE